LNLMKLELLSG